MDGFSLNRAALNGSVRAVVAGAALIVASGSVAATGTRIVTDAPQFVANGALVSTFTYFAMGGAYADASGTIQAKPGLLYTSTASFGTSGTLAATNTESYFPATGSFQATGTDIQNGSAAFVGNSVGTTAVPLYIAGTAASFVSNGAMSADASTTPNGSSYTYRDGYVNVVPIGGNLSASALRTAFCFANPSASSACVAIDALIQGGAAQLAGIGTLSATGAADAGWIICTGSLTALGQVTQNPTPILMAGALTFTAAQNVLTQGTVNAMNGMGMLTATYNLGVQASVSFQSTVTVSATGVNEKTGNWTANAVGTLTAFAGLLQQGGGTFASSTTLLANPLVNADSLDPPERTMIRPFIDRVMQRPFVNRIMQKEA
jgi:hypothetical protein